MLHAASLYNLLPETSSRLFGEKDLANVDSRALGGAIGTGLFIGSGAILSLVGPAPLFLGYISNMGTILEASMRIHDLS